MSEPAPRTCSRDFPGTVEAASDAENWVTGQASALGLGEEAEFAINLCLEELFLNAVHHGRSGEGERAPDPHFGPLTFPAHFRYNTLSPGERTASFRSSACP